MGGFVFALRLYNRVFIIWTGTTEMDQESPALLPKADWQTKSRGSNDAEYQIYVASAESLGWPVKTYEEWLGS